MFGEWQFAEVIPYLLVVFSLLVIWQCHKMKIMAE